LSISRTASLGDYRLTRIGLGTNRLTEKPENRAFLEAALDAGVNFIDTAHVYTGGKSERTIGGALAPFADDLVVATKGGYEPGTGRPEQLRAELEESFERLRTDTITLYYLHRVHPDAPLEDVEQIKRAQAVVPIAAVQNPYNLSERKYDDVVDFCERDEILFAPYYPLRGEAPSALDAIAARYDATPQQIALAWLLKRSPKVVPIPGTLSLEHLKSNLAALDLELSDEDYARLDGG
jgi:pyridoxine 4-dehydrogenase